MITTLKGRNLLAKAQTGVKLEFTRVMIGDGLLVNNVNLDSLTGLISPKMTVGIQSIEVIGNGTSKITVLVSNANLDTGFFVREIGVFAKDPDEGEVLYSIANPGDEADFLPSKGGSRVVEQELNLITIIGNAANVTAIIDQGAYITRKEFERIKAYLLIRPIDGGNFLDIYADDDDLYALDMPDIVLDGGVY